MGFLLDQIQGKSPDSLPPDIADMISFDKVKEKWFIEENDSEYYYNNILERWIPFESSRKREIDSDANDHNSLYSQSDVSGELRQLKKQKMHELKESKAAKKQPREVSSVFVSQLPSDVTVAELQDFFEKYGIIAEDITSASGAKRIKMYEDDQGVFKGEALITYLRPQSCELAINFADGTKLRDSDNSVISVKLADFSRSQNSKKKHEETQSGEGKSRTKIDLKDKVIQSRIRKMNKKLEDWDDEDTIRANEIKRLNEEKVVIIKNCFTLKELEEDPSAQLDIKDDIREGCEELGEVTNVILYDLEPQGIVSVRFASSAAANLCVLKMNGRFFSGMKLDVSKYDGYTKYSRTRGKDSNNADSGDKEQQRLEEFSKWIEE